MAMIEEEFKPCTNLECVRKVKTSVAFCCANCAQADERGYEIHESGPLGHSTDCNQRNMIRGSYTRAEARLLR